MKKWIVAFLAGAAFAAVGPAHAERMLTNWVDVAQKPKLLTNDVLMHKQLCATDISDSSCTDNEPTAKDLLLAVNPKSDGPPSDPIPESPPALIPITATPTVTAVPEPGNMVALALGAALVFAQRRRGRAG